MRVSGRKLDLVRGQKWKNPWFCFQNYREIAKDKLRKNKYIYPKTRFFCVSNS